MPGITRKRPSGARRFGAWKRCILVAAIAGIAGALLLDPGAAFAGACKKTRRTATEVSVGTDTVQVETIVLSEKKYGVYSVVIKWDAMKVESGSVSKNGAVNEVSKLLHNIEASEFSVEISPAVGESDVTTCTFIVSTDMKGINGITQWEPEEAGSLCSGPLNISCNKNYRSGKSRWITTFVIND